MKAKHLQKGTYAELLARKYLEKNGLKLLEQNYQCKAGEIDLIMRHGSELVFVEVRYRQKDAFGQAAESVVISKQRKIIRTAEHYLLSRYTRYPACRFDVISITGQAARDNIQWIPDAFQSVG